MRLLFAVLPLLWLLSGVAAAQEGRLHGTVLDSRGTGIGGARVGVPAVGRSTLTAADGTYRLDSLPVTRFTVVVSAVGFETQRRAVDVVAGGGAPVVFRLEVMVRSLDAVVVRDRAPPDMVRPAPDRLGQLVVAGARSEVLTLTGTDANLAEKVPRQVFARIPGVLVYDMDGAGNQTNISTRGLDPHRSWEFNVRQDGILVNSDIYGYPASHYSPPLEAMEQVELVRGTASLQYGSQFGGLLNYVTRRPDTTRALSGRASISRGSFDLTNVFAEAGGRAGAVEYQGYAAWRDTEGYRDGASSRYDAQFLAASWHASPALSVRAQVGRSSYRHRIPGPLTDVMFDSDPRAATRRRNWFSPDIVVPALRLTWAPSPATRITAQWSGVFGDRSSVQFVGFATVADTVNATTGQFAPRVVDIDRFDSHTSELRLTHEHQVGGRPAVLAAGVTLADNDLHRQQQGPGTRGTGYDLTVSGAFGRDLHYRSWGAALYVEDALRLTDRWTVIPGIRIERGRTDMEGRLAYYDPSDTPRRVLHNFPLFGLRSELALSGSAELYGGWSQAFRPMLLKDLLPENALERTDPEMKDARGWTAEGGVRGTWKGRVSYDVGAFLMRYDDRFGGLLRDDGDGPYLFKTNVGSTRTLGLEATIEGVLAATERSALRAFMATAVFDAVYRQGTAVDNGVNVALSGKRVEGVPDLIVRSGLTADRGTATLTALVSYTASSYADALNTRLPPVTGARGLVPSYTVVDLFGSRRLAENLRLRFAVSNLLNRTYFTKRPAFYPGPGVWPSDGRSVQLTLTVGRE